MGSRVFPKMLHDISIIEFDSSIRIIGASLNALCERMTDGHWKFGFMVVG
jgi:hypothetical protein